MPLAKPLQYVADDSVFDIVCHVYGDASEATSTLFEDDGVSYDFESKNSYNWLLLDVKNGKGKYKRKRFLQRQAVIMCPNGCLIKLIK